MKKVIIGILAIIPVIIVLVVAMISVFISVSAYIAVDDITIDKDYLQLQYQSGEEVYKLKDLIDVSITPLRASNKSFNWTIEDLVCIDENYNEMWSAGNYLPPAYVSNSETSEDVDNIDQLQDSSCSGDGFLHINTYCSFVLKAQAETHTVSCRVYVVGFEVETINIVNDSTLTIGQNALLQVETNPLEAIVETWLYESSDNSVVKVDSNGVLNAVGAGSATISVKASVYGEENKFVEDTIEIVVEEGATKYGNAITTSSNEILLADLGVDKKDVSLGMATQWNSAGDGIILEQSTGVIVASGQDVTLTKCDEGEIVIDNSNLFEAKDEGGYVLATDGVLYLSASFADDFVSQQPEVTWSSNREAIAKVDSQTGVVNGISTGTVIITATTAEGKTASLTINVQEVVTVLLIETPDACAEEGIAKETIVGSMVYDNLLVNLDEDEIYNPNVEDFNFTKKDNSFEFNFQNPVLPEGANKEEFYSAFNFKVQEYVDGQLVDSNKARFELNRMIFNGEAIDGLTELVVTISAKYPKLASHPEYATNQFTIKVTKGIAVTDWYQLMAVDEENRLIAESNKDNNTEVATWDMCLAEDIRRAGGYIPDHQLIEKLDKILVKLHQGRKLSQSESQMWAEHGEEEGLGRLKEEREFARHTTIVLRCNLYGNGHMIYGFKDQYDGTGNTMLRIIDGNVTISNAIIRACEVGDMIVENPEETDSLLGTCIRYESEDPSDFSYRLENNVIEYCIIENAAVALRIYGTDVTIDGCIVRNTSGTAMYVPINRNETGVRYSHININNCIYSNLLGTSMSVQFDSFSDGDDPASVQQALEDQAAGRTFVLTQTGFWDIHNWQPLSTLSLIPEIGDFNEPIREAVKESEKFKAYSRTFGIDKTEYFHLGFIISGFKSITEIETPYPVCTFEDERIQQVSTLEVFEGETGFWTSVLSGLLGDNPVYLYTYGKNGELTPESTYTVEDFMKAIHQEN